MSNPKPAPTTPRTPTLPEQQFVHLVRLAWDVHTLGVRASVELSEQEPVLLVTRTSQLPLAITAQLRGEEWWLTWGRSAENSVRALADDAADRIWQVVR